MSDKNYDGFIDYLDTGLRKGLRHQDDNWVEEFQVEDDRGPVYLLCRFRDLADSYFTIDIDRNEYPLRGREMPDLSPVSGEIEWRTMHSEKQ